MTDTLELISSTREAAHDAATAIYRHAQQVIADGKPARMVVEPFERDRSLQQNAYYWGVVLKEIAEQANLGGDRYVAEAWHIHFKRLYLGYSIKKVQLPGKKRKSIVRELKSTKRLSVRKFSKYLEKVMAFAVTDLGVRFSLARWEEYQL